MNNTEEIKRGREAKQLLEHPLIVEAFAKIEQEVITSWQTSPARDTEAREQLYLMQALLRKVQQHLVSVAETGMLAAATVQSQSNRASGRSTLLD